MATQTDEKVSPHTCQKCGTLQYQPPAQVRILAAMSPGAGSAVVGYTQSAIARGAGMSKQQAGPVIKQALAQGLIERVPGIEGGKLYRKTKYGTVLLSTWRSKGWRPKPK